MNARVVETYSTVMIKKWFHPSQERQSAVYNWAYIIDVFLPCKMAIKTDIKQFSMLNLFNYFPSIITSREWSFRRWSFFWDVIKIDLVLDVLRAMPFKFAHANTPGASRLRRAFNSWIVELDWVIELTSANIVRVVFCGRKKRGARMLPCGTPIDTGRRSESVPLS